VTCPSNSTLMPGDSNGTIDVGGMTRNYILHVPPGYTGDEPVPLLVDWHPLTQSAQFQRTSSGYAQVADREGFIVAYPDGIDNAWNIGPCCTRSRDVDDLGFARALVDKIKSQACIDPKRVYAAGFSMGGGMSHFLGCKAADVFAAVAPAAFDLIEEYDCTPSRPITVISFRGTADFIVPYAGGASTPPTPYPLDPIHFLGAQGTFEKWAELNQCTGEPMDTGGGCETYTQCAQGVEVTLCTSGGGHSTGDPDVGWPMLAKHPMP
jgi:polyhydroxybutyrate depolymerase